MRISLNWLKDYLDIKPDISILEISNTLTMAGLEVEGVENILAKDFKSEMPNGLLDLDDNYSDTVITLGITPNRADALSHLGISRELSALLDLSPKNPLLSFKEMAGPTHEKAVVEIEDPTLCPRYSLRVIENITVCESPNWLKTRLLAVGIRPINNVVDVTNYVMISRGQPMHAFDYDKVMKSNNRAKIIIRRASADESLVLLDNRKINLSTDDLVIADEEAPIALAGVMGGLHSSISMETKTVLLESAYFHPKSIRNSAKKHGIITDGAYRFERGTDPNGVVDALNMAALLLVENFDARSCREVIDVYKLHIEPLEIKMRPERARAILGMSEENFQQDALRSKFLKLGIETVAKRGDAIYFRVPTFRSDLTREIDLIEESARMIGYDKVNESAIGSKEQAALFANNDLEITLKKLRESFLAKGFFEAINYSFLNKEWHSNFIKSTDENMPIEVKNPLSERYAIMRQSLVPGLISNLQHNLRNQEKSVQLFEFGTVFLRKRKDEYAPDPKILTSTLDQDSFCIEEQRAAGVICGHSPHDAFDSPAKTLDFYDLKGMLADALRLAGLNDRMASANIFYEPSSNIDFLHPGESIAIYYDPQISGSSKSYIGHLGKLHPNITSTLDLPHHSYVFELNTQLIAQNIIAVPRFKPFSRYPSVERDVALLADEEITISQLLEAAHAVGREHNILREVKVFDIYRGKNIETGKKSVAISFILQHLNRTLRDEESTAFIDAYLQLVEKTTGAKVR